MLSIPALLAAILIGVSLGLIGGGGSILTVPALTYLADVNVVSATAYSLFIVGISSAVGSINFIRKKQVDLRTAVVFAVPSLIAVWLTRAFLIPAIPDIVFSSGSFTLSKDLAIMVFFSLIMILASVSMIRNKKKTDNDENKTPQYNYPIIILEGFVVGTVTGIVGAGGGFLIIPALVILAKIPMKKAVGTSLLIIATKSLIGFTGDLSNAALVIDWAILLPFTLLAVVGIFGGTYIGKFVPGPKLKKGFGIFILVMGVYIISDRVSKLNLNEPQNEIVIPSKTFLKSDVS